MYNSSILLSASLIPHSIHEENTSRPWCSDAPFPFQPSILSLYVFPRLRHYICLSSNNAFCDEPRFSMIHRFSHLSACPMYYCQVRISYPGLSAPVQSLLLERSWLVYRLGGQIMSIISDFVFTGAVRFQHVLASFLQCCRFYPDMMCFFFLAFAKIGCFYLFEACYIFLAVLQFYMYC